jgi:phosphate transport system protein
MSSRQDFDNNIERLQKEILKMAYLVENSLKNSIKGLVERNEGYLKEAIAGEELTDNIQQEIEDIGVSNIALQQPVGRDLRLIISSLFIANDFERIGDLIRNICKASIDIIKLPPLKPFIDIPRMAEICIEMIDDIIKAMLQKETSIAITTAQKDDIIDKLNNKIWRELLTYMMEDPQKIEQANKIIFVAKQLERIGDHITNIAERVCYIEEGKILDLNE